MATELFMHRAPNSIPAAWVRAGLLRTLRFDRTKVAMDAGMEADGHILSASRYYGGDQFCPRCYAASTIGGDVHLFIDGIDTDQQGVFLWDYYTGYGTFAFDIPARPGFTEAARRVAQRVLLGLNAPPNLFVNGYSFGGGVGAQILDFWPNPLPSNLYASITAFGSPKAGMNPNPSLAKFDAFAHWQNVDDSVPLIPPALGGLTRFMSGLSLNQARRLASFSVWPGGIGISLSSVITPNPVPNVSSETPSTQIGQWLRQQSAGIENAHSINVYRARLELAASRVPTDQSSVQTSTGGGADHIPSLAEVRTHSEAFAQTIFADATRQNAQPVNVPEAQYWTAQRVGKIWYVYFGETPVAIAPYRKRARGMARIGNDLLRRMQNLGVVNDVALTAQFAAYISSASDPNGGFTPVMRTQID